MPGTESQEFMEVAIETMNETLLILASGLPIALLFLLMAVFRQPAVIAAPVVFIVTVAVATLAWGMPGIWIGASLIKAFFVTTEILLIVFGAILLLNVLRVSGAFKSIELFLSSISRDRRIQAILVGWFFVSFIEGMSGFGTPAALAAPLLVAIGFPPLAAVVAALIGNSTAVTFGAVGVPMTIGIGEGLGGIFVEPAAIAVAVATQAAFIHLFIGAMIPLILSVAMTFYFGGSMRRGFEILPYALLAGISFTAPYYLVAAFLGAEFPSILGALLGGGLMIFLTKKRFLTPKKEWDFPTDWKPEWGKPFQGSGDLLPKVTILKAILPYAAILSLLLFTRLNLWGAGDYLRGLALEVSGILGTTVAHSWSIFYSPGFLFIIVALIFSYYFRVGIAERKEVFLETLRKVKGPAAALIFIIAVVQILIFSGNNDQGLASIPLYLAGLATGVGEGWVWIAPFVGALGAFIAGSSTVSNLLFSAFQAETALAVGISPILILALQGVGSAVGNMVAIHNIIAALATVGMLGKEGLVLRKNLLPVFIYLLFAGGLGFILLGRLG